jgi:hypothetical protein
LSPILPSSSLFLGRKTYLRAIKLYLLGERTMSKIAYRDGVDIDPNQKEEM